MCLMRGSCLGPNRRDCVICCSRFGSWWLSLNRHNLDQPKYTKPPRDSSSEIKQRETLYADFISACCKLAIDSYQHSLESMETILPAFELLNRIRLFSSDEVLAAAEQTLQKVFDQYSSRNITPEQLYELGRSGKGDIVRSFSEACRQELKVLRSRGRRS